LPLDNKKTNKNYVIYSFLLSGYSTDPSAFLTGFEYRTLNKPFVSILGLVIKKLIRKKPPKINNITTRGKLRPISENDSKNKDIMDSSK
tara:strand:+ start:71 stop:337 length:267 start_codon:yes stop_codon:yes gene_type:complete